MEAVLQKGREIARKLSVDGMKIRMEWEEERRRLNEKEIPELEAKVEEIKSETDLEVL